MNWLLVAMSVNLAGLGGLAAYRVRRGRRRPLPAGDPVPNKWPQMPSVWAPDLECGIAAVNRDGRVIGTVRVPAPSLN